MRCLPALLMLSASGIGQETPLGRGVNFYSIAQEEKLGREAALEFRKSARIVEAPRVTAYLEAMLKDVSSRFTPEYRFEAAIFDDRVSFTPSTAAMPDTQEQHKASEAVAFANGQIFFPLSRLKRVASEAEMHSLVAHAAAHVADRHVTRLMTRRQLVEAAAARMPEQMRKEHTLAVSQAALQDGKAFEKRAEERAAAWAAGMPPRPAEFEAVQKIVAGL